MAEHVHASKTEKKSSPSIVHDFDSNQSSMNTKLIGIWVGVAVLGLLTGYVLANRNSAAQGPTPNATPPKTASDVQVGKVYGSGDTSTYTDTAEGVMREGGINGEGQFHLERPGGDSQNVYLTSSTVDLSAFIGHKMKVWGQTQKAQTAGWLMDVGKVQVEN